MHDIDINELTQQIERDIKALDIEEQKKQRDELFKLSQSPDFWQDNIKATKIMQKLSQIEQSIESWQKILKDAQDLKELIELNDESLAIDIEKQLKILDKNFSKKHIEVAFDGAYDKHGALLSIHAGAGGTDAQDWASMLLRMYIRWAESEGYKTNILEESSGDEAGIKSVSLEVMGMLAFGKLKSEHGVHRLVRLSPFNANNLRQTSFAKVEILPEIDEPEEVPLDEKDLKIDVFRAGGHGGQSVNTTDSAVRITHLPTGISISIQNERSQLQNKETAMKILRSRLAQLQLEQHAEKISELKGVNKSAEWGNQIRNYVLHPYSLVKDLRTGSETNNTQAVLDGNINQFISAYIEKNI